MEKTNLFQNNFALPHLVVCSFAPSKLKSITVSIFWVIPDVQKRIAV